MIDGILRWRQAHDIWESILLTILFGKKYLPTIYIFKAFLQKTPQRAYKDQTTVSRETYDMEAEQNNF